MAIARTGRDSPGLDGKSKVTIAMQETLKAYEGPDDKGPFHFALVLKSEEHR